MSEDKDRTKTWRALTAIREDLRQGRLAVLQDERASRGEIRDLRRQVVELKKRFRRE